MLLPVVRATATVDRGADWRYSLGVTASFVLPVAGALITLRVLRREGTPLSILRATFVAVVPTFLAFLVAFMLVTPWNRGEERWISWVVIVVGALLVLPIARVRRQRLATASPNALVSSYARSFFAGVQWSSTAALLGLIGMTISGSLWLYAVGTAFALVGVWMVAPTKKDIDRRQREIAAAGSPLSLIDALVSVTPRRAARRRS
jgi:hypothetical protein